MKEEKLIKLQKKLDKMMSKKGKSQEQAFDILQRINEANVTLETLAKIKLGVTLNLFRKFSTDEQVKSLSKQILLKWKTLIPSEKNKNSKNVSSSKTTTSILAPKTENSKYVCSSQTTQKNKTEQKEDPSIESVKEEPKIKQNENTKPPEYENSLDFTEQVRSKCTEMLIQALNFNRTNKDCTNTKKLAEELENTIFENNKRVVGHSYMSGYRNAIRSRASNLRDVKNPNLRNNFLSGAITVSAMAVMSHDEMASDELRLLKRSYTKEGIMESRLATAQGTSTNLMQCGKCKKRNCTYNQLQTRSADEPMTTFVLCNDCGNRWKF